ncbi:MAG: hypothetical protein ACI9K2_001796 [Myxococcota bacterium]|jgi:hypothetical protein
MDGGGVRALVPALGLLMGCPPNDPGYPPFEDTGLWMPGETTTPTVVGTTTGSVTVETGDTGTVPTVPTGVRLDLGPRMLCADPSERDSLGPYLELPVVAAAEAGLGVIGSGVVVADWTGDGWLDVYWAGAGGGALHISNGQGGVDASDTVLGAIDLTNAVGGSTADVDGDGDLDLLVLRDGLPTKLLLGDGLGGFTDASDAWGVSVVDTLASTSTWMDVDGDGDLDLFIGGLGDDPEAVERASSPSYLLLNDGTRFVTAELPPALQDSLVHSAQLLPAPFGPSLVTAHDTDRTSTVWTVPAVAERLGDWISPGGTTALAVADVNRDGLPDLLAGGPDRLDRFLATGSPTSGVTWPLSDAESAGLVGDPVLNQGRPWSMVAADLDLDADVDVLVSFGPWASGEAVDQTDALFLAELSAYSESAEAWELADVGDVRGVVAADVSGDGWPDLVKNRRSGDDALHVSRCGAEHFLTVRTHQPGTANRFGIGTHVELDAGGRVQHRWVAAGTGYASGGPPEVMFGLGSAETVDALTVIWPDGTSHKLGELTADRVVTVVRE